MNFSPTDIDYLSGQKFSSGYHFKLEGNTIKPRITTLVDLVKDKKVLHLGCCDHIPLIEKKIEEHRWLHGILREVCSQVVGVDINQEAVAYLQQKGLGEDVYCIDLLENGVPQQVQGFDYVLLGEIVEHLDNPVMFLRQMARKCAGRVKKCIVTVPNAFRHDMGRWLRQSEEAINSDHRFWFTPYTISKVMMMSGICPTELLYSDNYQFLNRLYHKLTKGYLKWGSIRGQTIIAVGEIVPGATEKNLNRL